MRLAAPLASPYFEGTSGTSSQVPALFDCALDGLVWMFDTRYLKPGGEMKRSSVALYKPQSDDSGVVSERSLNPEDLARSSQESWHHGAGQVFVDRPDSNPYRFRSSKGIDCWDRWKLRLLPGTSQFAASANTNLRLAATSTRLFWLDGTAVKYDDDLSGSPSTMTGAKNWTSITTNGFDVWATDGTDVYHWERTATTVGSAWNTVNVDLLAWVRGKGRLMGALNTGSTRSVYNITGIGAPSDIAPSNISSDFTWVGFAEGPSCVYGAGYQGDKSLIFRWGIKDDGTGLDVAIPALVDGLPDGEIVRSIYSYAGFVVIGTDKGVRFATADPTSGDLNVGSLIEIGTPVRCFEGQGPHVWFGWSNFDSTSTGLGRIAPANLTDENVPAYASDLMATTQGDVLDVCTFLDKRIFAVSGAGIYAETTALTTDAWLRTGLISHGLPDPKVAMHAIVNHDELEGAVTIRVASDGGSFSSIGSSTTGGETARILNVGQVKAETFELEIVPVADGDSGPVVTRWTFESNPAPGRGEHFWVFLQNFDTIQDKNNTNFSMNTLARYQAILDMESDGRPVSFQDAGGAVTVFVDDHEFLQEKATDTFYDGTIAVKLRRTRRRV